MSAVTWGYGTGSSKGSGWAKRELDRRFYYVFYSEFWSTLERDGKIVWDSDRCIWTSQNGKILTYPCAIVDDYGNLVPSSFDWFPKYHELTMAGWQEGCALILELRRNIWNERHK